MERAGHPVGQDREGHPKEGDQPSTSLERGSHPEYSEWLCGDEMGLSDSEEDDEVCTCVYVWCIYISHVPKQALVPLTKRPTLASPFTMDEVRALSFFVEDFFTYKLAIEERRI